MDLQLRGFSVMVQNAVVAMQGATSALLDLTVGSPLRALMESCSSVAGWLQYQNVLTLRTTRLATSQGGDVDTYVNDLFMTRLPGVSATGLVTLSRFTATSPALVFPYINADGSINLGGVALKTADGTQVFFVATDVTNPLWSTATGAAPGYLIPAGVYSGSVPIQAANAGGAGNVAVGTITLLASAVSGVDTASNATALINGIDPESDAAVRARFQVYIAGLGKGTPAAIMSAIAGVQQNLTAQIAPVLPGAGTITIYVDDGSGSPPTSLITAVSLAVNDPTVYPIGTVLYVFGPTLLQANVNVSITTATANNHLTIAAAASVNITAYIASLPMGAPLRYLKLAQIVYDSNPMITSIVSLTINGGAADIGGSTGVVVRPSAITVS